jgi:hypothetical protein
LYWKLVGVVIDDIELFKDDSENGSTSANFDRAQGGFDRQTPYERRLLRKTKSRASGHTSVAHHLLHHRPVCRREGDFIDHLGL